MSETIRARKVITDEQLVRSQLSPVNKLVFDTFCELVAEIFKKLGHELIVRGWESSIMNAQTMELFIEPIKEVKELSDHTD
jgi:hypothetical protein